MGAAEEHKTFLFFKIKFSTAHAAVCAPALKLPALETGRLAWQLKRYLVKKPKTRHICQNRCDI